MLSRNKPYFFPTNYVHLTHTQFLQILLQKKKEKKRITAKFKPALGFPSEEGTKNIPRSDHSMSNDTNRCLNDSGNISVH